MTPRLLLETRNSRHGCGEYLPANQRKSNRGDRTPIELFLAGLAGWNAALRRYFPGENGGK